MIQLFDPAIGARRDVTPEEYERRTPDSSVPGGWRLMSVQEKAERDARLAAMRQRTTLTAVAVLGAVGVAGYAVAGKKGAVVAPLALLGVTTVLALALANR